MIFKCPTWMAKCDDQASRDVVGQPSTVMTAREDRNRCLAVGMNDYIAEPIDIDLMFEVLQRWMDQIGSGNLGSVSHPQPTTHHLKPIENRRPG